MFVWWEPGPMLVEDLRSALGVAQCVHLMPKSSTVPAALKETLSAFIEAAKIKVRGSPVDINPLREDIKGFEAVKQDRGDDQNFHDFVMSVILDEATNTVKIAKHNPQYVPQADLIKDQLEAKMTEVFHERLDWMPTSMVSGCLARVISHLGGILCRRAGGVYFLPDDAAGRFMPLADALDGSGGGMSVTITKFNLKPGERSYELVLKSLRKEVNEALADIEEGLKELGGKPKANGQATRMNTLDALKVKVTKYEALLGVTMQDTHEAVEKVKAAVAARNVMEMCV
jgi:hypothetical protein